MRPARNRILRIVTALTFAASLVAMANVPASAHRSAAGALPILHYSSEVGNPTWPATLDPRIVAGKKPNTYLTNDCSAGVGAGAFMYKCRNNSYGKGSFYPPGSSPTITLVPNPNYYGPKPHIQIVIRQYATSEVGYRAY